MSEENVNKSAKQFMDVVRQINIYPTIKKEQGSEKLKNKHYVVLPNTAKTYDEFKDNLGAMTYVELSIDSGADNHAAEYYKTLKDHPRDFTLQVKTKKEVIFHKNRDAEGNKSAKEFVISAKELCEPTEYSKEYSKPKDKKEQGKRVRLYIAAKEISNGQLREDVKISIEIDKKNLHKSFKLIEEDHAPSHVNIFAENVDESLIHKLGEKIKNNSGKGVNANYESNKVMAALACVHKCGADTYSKVYSNISKKNTIALWQLLLEHEGEEPVCYKKNATTGKMERTSDKKNPECYHATIKMNVRKFDEVFDKIIDALLIETEARFGMIEIHKVLQKFIKDRLRQIMDKEYIRRPAIKGNSSPNFANGIPGLHAEIFAINELILEYFPGINEHDYTDLNRITEITQFLSRQKKGQNYHACANCSEILYGRVRMATGKNHRPERKPPAEKQP